MTKMTYVKALEIAVTMMKEWKDGQEVSTNGDITPAIDKLIALKAQVEKKNSADRKPTKAQAENAELKDRMVEALTEQMTATEVANAFGISINKSTALLTQLVEAKRVEREVIKRKAYFKAVA